MRGFGSRLRGILPAAMIVIGITIGAAAAYGQPDATDPAPAVAPATPEAAPAAPAAPVAVPAPAVAPAVPEADVGEAVAPGADNEKAEAPAADEAPAAPAAGLPPSGESVIAAIRRAVETREWGAALAALALIFAYALGRATLIKKIPWGVGRWLTQDDFGGVVGAFAMAFLGTWGMASLAGGGLFEAATLVAALKVAVFASGGYGGIWKKLPWVKSRSAEAHA